MPTQVSATSSVVVVGIALLSLNPVFAEEDIRA